MMKFIRRFGDLGINGVAARWYDGNSRRHRIGEMREYAEEVAGHINEGSTVLDVATGPGYLAIELAKMGNYRVTGMDISSDFVEIARRNARQSGASVNFRQGNVSDMPFADNMFDFIVCTAAFKNFRDPVKALTEMYRVLKEGGTAMIKDLKNDVTNEEINDMAKGMQVMGIEAAFMKMTFKYFLRKGAYTKDQVDRLISETNFGESRIETRGVTLSIYLKKSPTMILRD